MNADAPSWLVVPTYNERENLAALAEQVSALGLEHLHMLVVDDASPDGTGELAEQLTRRLPRLHVLHRERKEGLGPAYRAGFRIALSSGAQRVLQMDADLSHPVAMIPVLLAAAERADLVIGSRYVPGGNVQGWNWPRRFLSRLANVYARMVLGVPIRDLTAGFKCFRREALEAVHLHTVSAIGYHFQIELTHRTVRAGLRVVEVPITFTERQQGRSKFHFPIILESIVRLGALRRRRR